MNTVEQCLKRKCATNIICIFKKICKAVPLIDVATDSRLQRVLDEL